MKWTSPRTIRAVPLIAAALVLAAGCGGNSYKPDPSELAEDKAQAVTYPSGPYGKTKGATIANLEFNAVFDPFFLCKKPSQEVLEPGLGPQKMNLEDVYKGNPMCAQKAKRLAWFVIGAGW